jgi:SRSO17 transposase
VGQRYLTGLLLPIARKNVENIAKQVGAPARNLSSWSGTSRDDAGCVVELQRLVGKELGAPDGALVIDDTGLPRRGRIRQRLAGSTRARWAAATTARSGCSWGMPGRMGTPWWIGALEGWFDLGAAARRRRAEVPEGLGFATKPELAAELLGAANAARVLPFR